MVLMEAGVELAMVSKGRIDEEQGAFFTEMADERKGHSDLRGGKIAGVDRIEADVEAFPFGGGLHEGGEGVDPGPGGEDCVVRENRSGESYRLDARGA